MSKLVKGVTKAVKSVVRGVKKVFSKITSSTIGKVLIGTAAVFLGGAALGLWQSPFAGINGALAGGAKSTASNVLTGAATETAATTAATTATGASSGIASNGIIADSISKAAAGTVDFGVKEATSSALSSAAQSAVSSGATATATETAKNGIIAKILDGGKKAATWAKNNPKTASTIFSGIAAAAGPDELDILRERKKLEDEERERRRQNLDVTDVSLNMAPRSNRLRRSNGQPVYDQQTGGLIYSRMRGGV
jgi:hypothetical protein